MRKTNQQPIFKMCLGYNLQFTEEEIQMARTL